MTPQFTFQQVADLAGVEVATVRDWFNRKHGAFSLHHTDQKAPSGGTRRLSPFTLVAVSLAAQLTRLGVPISRAATAGMTFAHTQRGTPRRDYPGALYGEQRTLLAVDAHGDVRIFPASAQSNHFELLSVIRQTGGATVIEVDQIIAHIEKQTRLNFPTSPAKSAADWGANA